MTMTRGRVIAVGRFIDGRFKAEDGAENMIAGQEVYFLNGETGEPTCAEDCPPELKVAMVLIEGVVQ